MLRRMADAPWLTIVGVGEDGPEGLSPASRAALEAAEIVWGAPRHLALLPGLGPRARVWPTPFADGLREVLAARGRPVAALASGDPFWFGAGSTLSARLSPGEWRALPAVSSFALAAARLGWPLESTDCLGLHAAPLARLRPRLAPGRRLIALLRDGPSVADVAAYLVDAGFGASCLHVLEALGGPRERVRATRADAPPLKDAAHPVAVAIEVAGDGPAMPCVPGLADAFFQHDGQITKRPIRALTLATLAPRPGERLWDIGAGAGSISIEWLLAHPANAAVAIEADPTRAERLRGNAGRLGVDRIEVATHRAPDGLEALPPPQAVFVGGGLSRALLERLWTLLTPGVRVVANAVTLESEALLAEWRAVRGGALTRIELSEAAPLGVRSAWRAAYPVTQWSGAR